MDDTQPQPEPDDAPSVYSRLGLDGQQALDRHLKNSRRSRASGRFRGRITSFQALIVLDEHRDQMNPRDVQVLERMLVTARDLGTDRLTIALHILMKGTGLDTRAVRRSLARLEKQGWLRKVETGSPDIDKHRANTYRINNGSAVTVAPRPSRRGNALEEAVGKPSEGAPLGAPPLDSSGTRSQVGRALSEVALSDQNGGGTTGEDGAVALPETTVALPDRLPIDEWLRQYLTWGPRLVRDVVTAGIRGGYSRRAIYRSANRVGVQRHANTLPGKPPVREVWWELG